MDLETDAFCEILADGEYSFSITLEKKALKKQANKEVLEEIQGYFKTAILDLNFIERVWKDLMRKLTRRTVFIGAV